MDDFDKRIINDLQAGFPISERPYRDAAPRFGIAEGDLIARLGRLLDRGALSRFGPIYNAERIGGAVCLCAMAAADRFEVLAAQVNSHLEVAHNYERVHALNMWFVLAVDRPERIDEVVAEIEEETNTPVFTFPKLEEFFVGFRVEV